MINSKTFGAVLLLGLALVVVISFTLLMVQWVRSSGDVTPVPTTKKAAVQYYTPPASGLILTRSDAWVYRG